MIYRTSNWPCDLTREQQVNEERVIVAQINSSIARIVPLMVERVQALVEKAKE